MRKFSSYGPIVNTSEFYAPRENLVDIAERGQAEFFNVKVTVLPIGIL